MTSEAPIAALMIKSGPLEISATGQFAISALVLLVIIFFIGRLWFRRG